MTSNEKQPFLNMGLTYGAIAGIGLVLLLVLLYCVGDKELVVTGLGHYLVLSYAIHRCQAKWKSQNEDATYGKLFLIGLICGASASVFVDLYAAVYAKVLNPGYVEQSVAQSMEVIRGMKLYGQHELEQAAGITRSLFVCTLAISTTIAYALASAFFSAIFAFFVNKRKKQQ